jgi:hypothetical protein
VICPEAEADLADAYRWDEDKEVGDVAGEMTSVAGTVKDVAL